MVQKELRKLFSIILERVFEMVWWRGRKWNHIKKDIFEGEKFFSSLPLYLKRLLFFFFLFSLFFYAPSLEDLQILMIFEEKIISSKTSFQMAWHVMTWSWLWIYWRWTHILEWSYARQYRYTMIMDMWELWIYRRWTHIPELNYAHQYFWVRLANNVGSKSFLKKFKTQLDTSLNKTRHKQELLYEKIFGSGRNV
jgi:hypothetical protein